MKKIYTYTLATFLIWGAAGCKKPSNFGDANLDHSATTKPIVSALLANVEGGLTAAGAPSGVGTYASTASYAINGGAYAQYFSETQYPGTSLYSLPQISFTADYNGNLYDLQNIINLNQDKNSVAVAKILQSYIFWVLTDSYGDIPYSQALKGLAAINPAYDKQEDIYKGILATLASAVSSFDGQTIAGDLIYGGDPAAWKRAANSLRMLVAIQLSKVKPGASDYAATAFNAALADPNGVITTNAQNFALTYTTGTFKDPWWNLYNGRTDWAESKTMTDYTKSTADGRSVAYGGSFSDPGQVTGGTVTSNVGVPYGVDRPTATAFTAANSNWALILRADYRQPQSTVYIVTAAEVALAKAEAANIGWLPAAGMVTDYMNGINLSFAQWGLPAPDPSYFTSANVAISPVPGTANEQNIAVQQWVTAYPDGHMGWDIWRKTGYPVLTPAPAALNTSKKIVRRFIYASSEYTTNPVSVKAAVARESGGVDSQDNHVWWDVRP